MRLDAAVRRLVACSFVLAAAGVAAAANWPQWRGPNNDGVSRETGLPTQWDGTQNIAWKLPLPGMGGSTPAVWGDRIFLTCADGRDIVVMCVSTAGKELWKQKFGTDGRPFMGGEGNNASASPATDGKHVYVFAGSGELACFDLDGKEVWKFNAQERYGRFKIQFGMHTTPVLYGERLYLQLIHSGGAWVIALDRNTGETVWKVERKSDGRAECEHSYASPCVWHRGNEAYLITHGNDYAIAHRLDNGEEMWRVVDLNPKDRYNPTLRFVSSPVATPDLIVVPSAKNHAVVGVKPDATGTIAPGSPSEQWRRPTGTPDVPSPLVHGGLVYLCSEGGILTCLHAKTGEQLYQQSAHRDRHRASPVYADGKIYLTAHDGTVSVIKAGPQFERLATNRLDDQLYASPVIANGRIYLRGFKSLYAIEKKN